MLYKHNKHIFQTLTLFVYKLDFQKVLILKKFLHWHDSDLIPNIKPVSVNSGTTLFPKNNRLSFMFMHKLLKKFPFIVLPFKRLLSPKSDAVDNKQPDGVFTIWIKRWEKLRPKLFANTQDWKQHIKSILKSSSNRQIFNPRVHKQVYSAPQTRIYKNSEYNF